MTTDKRDYLVICPPEFRSWLRDPDATHLIVETGRQAKAGALVIPCRPDENGPIRWKVQAEGDGTPWAVAVGEHIKGRWSDKPQAART